MKFPSQRLAQLFATLQSEALPQHELARRFAVSTRTVRNDISTLNQLLAGYGVQLVLNRGAGYQLKIEDASGYARLQAGQPACWRVPRTSGERVKYLLIRFLTSASSSRLEDLADEWCVSRATLQSDMAQAREHLTRYQLVVETRPRYGMKLSGSEMALRACLTDLLDRIAQEDDNDPLLMLAAPDSVTPEPIRQECFNRFNIRLSDENERWLRLYCAVMARRISEGHALNDFRADDVEDEVRAAACHIIHLLRPFCGKTVSPAEVAYLGVNIAARRIGALASGTINADDGEHLVAYILSYISERYNYHLQHDLQLRADLLIHIKTMITRMRYQIKIPNPLLSNIKQHYPMAWDVTLAAISDWSKHSPYVISENEIGFLVLHIGVGLERHYHVGYRRHPRVLLVCDTGNSTMRMLQAILLRHYPRIEVEESISLRDYQQLPDTGVDFVISTVRVSEKGAPVVVMSPFPTDYQLEQLGKLVLVDRTRPWMLARYFDASHFCLIDQPIDRTTLFQQLCRQLEREGVVDAAFYPSVEKREAMVSTLLGDGIALPHSPGLLARRTVIYTVLAPQGIVWGDEVAWVIFLLAISKEDYEEAMAIYDLFVTFVRERAMPRLRACQDFDHFITVANDCLSRVPTLRD